MGRKYYRTIITIEVLTADAPHSGDVGALAYDITEGDASGRVTTEVEEVTAEKMAELLKAQGSDPEFLLSEDDLAGS